MSAHRVINILIVVFLLVLQCYNSNAQFEGLKNKAYIEQLQRDNKLYDHELIMSQPDSHAVFAITSALRHYAIKQKDGLQLFNADYADITYIARNFHTQKERIIATLISLIKREQKSNNLASEVKARRFLANYYWNPLNEYERAFEEYLQLNERLSLLSPEEYHLKSMSLFEIGKAYFYFNEYDLAASFFKRINKPPATASFNVATGYKPSLNYLAIIKQKVGKIDSSNHFLQLLSSYAREQKDTTWLGIAFGYMGYNLLSEGKYGMAEPLIKNGIDIALQDKDTGWVIRQKLWLAELYFKQNNASEAIPLVQWAQKFTSQNITQSPDEVYELLYPLLAKLYAAQGQESMANSYLDSSILFKDKLSQKFSGLLLARAQQKLNLELERNIIKLKNAKSKERNILLGFVSILLLFALYINRLQQKKYIQQKQLNEAMLRQQELELSMAKDQLQTFSKKIAGRNKMLDFMEKQFGGSSIELLPEALQKSTIITNQDWDKFKILFEKVHSGYLHNLKQKLPELSPAETRYMALAKLNFSNKEMAFSLGVSPESIRVTLHRIRKKLELPEDISMEDLVASI